MKIDFKLLGYLILVFVLFTVVGTVSHEYGHYVVAEGFGLKAKVHYGYTSWDNVSPDLLVTSADYFWITFGGPLQTMLVGTLGLILMYSNRNAFRNSASLLLKQWAMIFVALFWLRFPFNFLSGLPRWIERGKMTGRSDEVKLARYLEWPLWSVSLCFALLGSLVLGIVLFHFVPKNQRLTFVVSGLIGGLLGFYLWLGPLGKLLMP